MTKVLAVINFLDREGHVDNDLPGHGHPDNSLPGHGHPDHDLPSPPWFPQPPTIWPPKVTDPEWGIEAGRPHPDHPIFIPIEGHPDNSLPNVPGHPAPPIATVPPGTIWPPLPVVNPPAPPGNAALLVWLIGVGWRYVIVTIPVAEPK